MAPPAPLLGLHHVTATADEAQPDVDFYTGLLGLRLVKKTVNFDNPGVYHFYYGNEQGTPGTIFTTFPYAGMGVRQGVIGTGQIVATSFSVPSSAVASWAARFAEAGLPAEPEERFGEPVLTVRDPSGLVLDLVGDDQDDRLPWTGTDLDADAAIRGIHHVTLRVEDPDRTERFLTEVLGFEAGAESDGRHRVQVGEGGAGRLVEIMAAGTAPRAINGLGTVHHVAFAIATEAEQLAIRDDLLHRGVQVTQVMDRQYFKSIYFREPGGVLYEIATVPPGFQADESLDALGTGLKLPPWEEPKRAAIERALPVLAVRT